MIDRFISKSLSRQALFMAIAFVMIAEVLILVPSTAFHRQDWLEDRAVRAGHLSLALTGVPNYEGSDLLSTQFMTDTDIILVQAQREGMTQLIVGAPPSEVSNFKIIDLTTRRHFPNIWAMGEALLGPADGYLRVQAPPIVDGQEMIEYIVPEASLQRDMRDYVGRILILSLIIALITGAMLYLALAWLIVRPIRELADGLARFREAPEKRRSYAQPKFRSDEIGQLQTEFFDMKESVRKSMRQQDRLAKLGLAVAKINHDLRNVLTTAQLVSDRLAMEKDTRVANMGERLVRAIDRGVRLCAEVLDFSTHKETTRDIRKARISLIVGEAAADALDPFSGKIRFENQVPTGLDAMLDVDHTYRIFHNLFRNAGQAMMDEIRPGLENAIIVWSKVNGDEIHIQVQDTGPGLPEKVKENLFSAFNTNARSGSTGLGLIISRELANDQGGDIILKETSERGTIFTVILQKPVDAQD